MSNEDSGEAQPVEFRTVTLMHDQLKPHGHKFRVGVMLDDVVVISVDIQPPESSYWVAKDSAHKQARRHLGEALQKKLLGY